MLERFVLIGILVAAVAALVVMVRRSLRGAVRTGACAGCPVAGSCDRSRDGGAS
jgi:hypothetical protein